MTCKRCQNMLPDNADACPVCGTSTGRSIRKKQRPMKYLILCFDFLALVMNLINAAVWVTAGHSNLHLHANLWYARQVQYQLRPELLVLDIIFAVFLIAIPVVSTMARFHLMKKRRSGVILMLVTHVALLAWSILYPALIHAITGVSSSLLGFLVGQVCVYFLFAGVSSVVILKSDSFIY